MSSSELLLDAVMENSSIKAAVIVDDRGYIVEKRGAASSLKNLGEQSEPLDLQAGEKKPLENLYMVQAGKDILVVIFDDRLSFEHLKKSVDQSLARFNMAPGAEE